MDATIQLMRGHYVALVTLSAAAQIPLTIGRILLARVGIVRSAAAMILFGRTVTARQLALGGMLAVVILVASVVFQGAMTVVAADAYLDNETSPAAGLRRTLTRFWQVVFAWLFTIITLGGIFVIIFAGMRLMTRGSSSAASVLVFLAIAFAVTIYFAVRISPLYCVVLLEARGIGSSIERMWLLGRGRVAHMFGALGLIFVVYLVAAVVVTAVTKFIGFLVTRLADPTLAEIVQSIGVAVIGPFVVCAIVVLYYDLRIRDEGLDVEIMSRSLGAAAAP